MCWHVWNYFCVQKTESDETVASFWYARQSSGHLVVTRHKDSLIQERICVVLSVSVNNRVWITWVNELWNKFDKKSTTGVQSIKCYTLVTDSNRRLMTLNHVSVLPENELLLVPLVKPIAKSGLARIYSCAFSDVNKKWGFSSVWHSWIRLWAVVIRN